MNGLIVQLTAEFAKIWSVSSRRLITFSRDDLPDQSHEGDWITIELDSNGVLQGMRERKELCGTRRDERGKMQVLDVFLLDSRRDKAFSEIFGVIELERGEEGGEWVNEELTKDKCFMLWMTVSSRAQFSIEKQSLERAYSKDGKYSTTYKSLLEEARKAKFDVDERKDPESFSETVLIVGYDPKCRRYFTSSQSGEAFIDHSVWKKHGELQRGEVYRATLRTDDQSMKGVEFKVIAIEKKVNVWEGVEVEVHEKDVRVDLDGKIVERRKFCYAMDTIPFGLVTYPLGLGLKSIPEDVEIGDYLRVRINRFKTNKPCFPSKWQVTIMKRRLPPLVKKKGEWFEGIVTFIDGTRVFISFKHGNALYHKDLNAHINLSLGTVVDICVIDSGVDSFFKVIDVNSRTRTREDVKVEKDETSGRAKLTVSCPAEVIERRDGFFLVDTPIIGVAQLFFNECPPNIKVGEIWNVKMHRRREKRDLASYWVIHSVVGRSPRSISSESSNTKEGRRCGQEEKEEPARSTDLLEEDGQWGTVIITGVNDGDWFAACYLADTITIPHSLVRDLKTPEKGEFYRIKCSLERGRWKAYELNPDPVYHKDFQVVKDRSLQVWCYAKIERMEGNAFTLFNDILGWATLPLKSAHRDMKVGDEIETLYYRVKNTSNPTHWMVQQAGFIACGSKRNRDTERSEDVTTEDNRMNMETRDEYSEKNSASRMSDETRESSQRERKVVDRRVLDRMSQLIQYPNIREILKKGNPKELEMIEKILHRDSKRVNQ